MDSITYNTTNLKMIESINGSKSQTTFKTLELLLNDKKLLEDYIEETPEDYIKIILK
jgi:hypothetical protein